jgi:hypothetical protein
MTTKVSGQLTAKGDSLFFRSGSITFNNVYSKPIVMNLAVPNGLIIADSVPAPITIYNTARNTWITKVPIAFASTSDIFVTGALIPSDSGICEIWW